MSETDYSKAAITGLEALQSASFSPNVLFTLIPPSPEERAEEASAAAFLAELCDLARLPKSVERVVRIGAFREELAAAPVADLSIFGLPKVAPDLDQLESLVAMTRGSCLFVADAGHEDARA